MSGWAKGVIVFLIVAILTYILYVGSPFGFKSLFYGAFKKTATIYLDYQTNTFTVLNGENISLKYSQHDENIAPFVLAAAENFYLQLQRKLNFNPGSGKVLVIVYPDRISLNNSFGLSGDRSADGVYWAGSIRTLSPYAMLPPDSAGKTAEEVFMEKGPLVHELTHYLVDRQTSGNYTRWLTEGLAQYLEREITGYTLESPARESQLHLYSLSSLDRDYDQQPDQVLAYWQSLETVDYLIKEHGIEKMQELLTALGQGITIDKALQGVYGLSLGMLNEAVQGYISSETSG